MLGGPRNGISAADSGRRDLSPVVLAHEQPFRVADVQFCPQTREVLRHGESHVIEPRVMQLLVALHRAQGAVVSKDDLACLVWDGRIVGEDAINRVVSRLRAVADKQAGGAFRVETITKVGYRLRAATGELALTDSDADKRISSSRTATRRQTLIWSAAAATVSTAGAIRWLVTKRAKLPPEAKTLVDSAEKSIDSATADGNSDAIGALRQAAAIAPDSAKVWGLLARAYMGSSRVAPANERQELRARALAAIQRAFAIEPNQPDALSAQITGMRVFRKWLAVERACLAALRVKPDHLGLKQNLLDVWMQGGRTREALPLIQEVARRLPDVAHVHIGEALALWSLGRLDEADAAIERSLARWPRFYAIWFTTAYQRMYEGRAAEAALMIRDRANRPIGIPDWNFDAIAQEADALASGDRAKIMDAVKIGVSIAHRGTGFAENSASFAAYVGDVDTAFSILGALYFNRGFAMPDTYFAPEEGIYAGTDRHTYNLFLWQNRALRRDPRFGALTRELGLDDYWSATGSRAMVTV